MLTVKTKISVDVIELSIPTEYEWLIMSQVNIGLIFFPINGEVHPNFLSFLSECQMTSCSIDMTNLF